MKAVRSKPAGLEGLGEAVEHVGPDHVAADAGMAPARQVEIGRHLRWRRGARRGRSRSSGCRRWCRGCARSGSATASAGARSRAASDSRSRAGRRAAPSGSRSGPCRDRAAASSPRGRPATTSRPAGPGDAGEVGHQRGLGDLHAVRMAGAARGELDVAKVGRLRAAGDRPASPAAPRSRPCRHAGERREIRAAASARKPARSSTPTAATAPEAASWRRSWSR